MKKNYTPEYKAKIVMELFREELTMGQLAAGYGIHPNLVSKWRNIVVEGMPELLADRRKRDKKAIEQEDLIQDLYAQIGELTTKLTWLKKIWHRHLAENSGLRCLNMAAISAQRTHAICCP